MIRITEGREGGGEAGAGVENGAGSLSAGGSNAASSGAGSSSVAGSSAGVESGPASSGGGVHSAGHGRTNTGAAGFRFAYEDAQSIQEKIEAVATKIYGAERVDFAKAALRQIHRLEELGYGNLPVCMAKTQYSLSDDPKKPGRPEKFAIKVKKVKPSVGAGFLVVLTGDIMTMPGLPKVPSAELIDVDKTGKISGLF